MKILVTGGCGFIGSALIRNILDQTDYSVINIDKLTYAANPASLNESLEKQNRQQRYVFYKTDILKQDQVSQIFHEHQPDVVMHLAAESHVDRSINDASAFVMTNVVGTQVLLDVARKYWDDLDENRRKRFRFLHISTDEVFGSCKPGHFFEEHTPYSPNSPYSASKAASDHLARAWLTTYGLPTIVSNCSNNYGPYQFPEKLIPLMILNAAAGKPLPVYGSGENIRDWLYVDDHVTALMTIATRGRIGATYLIGGETEKTNLEVVHTICDYLDQIMPLTPNLTHSSLKSRRELIRFVHDRPGHDLRYAIKPDRMRNELGFEPREKFESGIRKTVDWYLKNLR